MDNFTVNSIAGRLGRARASRNGLFARVYGVGNVTGDSPLQTAVLEDLAGAVRYRRWLAELARPFLGDDPIEIGSGTGDYAVEWASAVARFTASEADEARFAGLRERFAHHPVIDVRFLLLGEPTAGDRAAAAPAEGHSAEGHSAAVAVNVLEHIPDDVGALRAMGRLLRPGGAVVLIVPAFPSAMSRFDLAIGHQRRYTRAGLGAALAEAGLTAEVVRYVNPIGLLAWYAMVKGLRRTPRDGFALRAYDRVVVPVARGLDRWPPPFGQSVFAVARVRDGAVRTLS
jgi:SAM-dependent methyltransferase